MQKSVSAAAKSLQSCPTLCDPIDGSPAVSAVPGILQARILEWVAIAFSNAWKWKVKVKSLSSVSLFVIPWTATYQAPLSMLKGRCINLYLGTANSRVHGVYRRLCYSIHTITVLHSRAMNQMVRLAMDMSHHHTGRASRFMCNQNPCHPNLRERIFTFGSYARKASRRRKDFLDSEWWKGLDSVEQGVAF